MTRDEQTKLASDIRAGLAARDAARNTDTQRPAILDEAAPADPKARARFEEARETAERDYVDTLLSKGRLNPTETKYLASMISEAIRRGV
jgi:hypothetical protein